MSRSSSRGRVPNYQNETLLYNTIQDIKNMQTESYDTLKSIENYLLEIPEKYGVEIDIMIEAKAKEQSINHLYKKYPFLNCKIQ